MRLRLGFRSHIAGTVDIDIEERIDRKLRRFMGNSSAYNYIAMQEAVEDSGLTQDMISSPRTGLIAAGLLLGLAARLFGLPPLVGFLGAGFLFSAAGVESTPVLDELSHAGVLLLLFAVGLKLKLRTLLRVEIWGTAFLHLALIGGLGYAVIAGVTAGWKVALALAVAMGFSSTVFAVKVLEEKGEMSSGGTKKLRYATRKLTRKPRTW